MSHRRPKVIAISACVVIGIVNIFNVVRGLQPPITAQKDFIQEYLLAQAVITGLRPYDPLPTLAQTRLGTVPYSVFPHPTPHPPPVILLALPFGLFTYPQAATLWLLLELTCLYAVCRLLVTRYLGINNRLVPVLLSLGLCSSFPFRVELEVGQLMVPMLLPLTGAWLALRRNRDAVGGALLALPLAMKFIGWPLILFLIWRKRWRAVFWTGVTFILANLASTAIIGTNQSVYYYRDVAPLVSRLYRSEFLNFSTWAIGYRLFAGSSNLLDSPNAPPLFDWPMFAPYLSVVVTAAVLFLALWLAHTSPNFETSAAVLICASVVVNPIAWHHYLVLLLIPCAVTFRRLARSSFPRRLTLAAVLIGLTLMLPQLDRLVSFMAVGDPPTVPGPVGLLAFVPLGSALALMVLVWHASRSLSQTGEEVA